MKLTVSLFALLLSSRFAWRASGHGHSPEMIAMLNSPAPHWLAVGTPLETRLAKSEVKQTTSFHDSAGLSESTRTCVLIPALGIEVRPTYPVAWYRGSSLSPDGTRLIINSGTECNLLQIKADGTYRELEEQVPSVTYDNGPKGFITGWYWGNNEVMLAEAEVHSDNGTFVDRRIYGYHLDRRLLRRMDLSGLKLESNQDLRVKSIGSDSQHLLVELGEREFAVDVDFRPESFLAGQDIRDLPDNAAPLVKPKAGTQADAGDENAPFYSKLWLILAALAIIVLFVLLIAWRRKSEGRMGF